MSWAKNSRGFASPEPKRCFLCGKSRQQAVCCEDWQRLAKAAPKHQAKSLFAAKPEDVIICKDCCIAALKGHRCIWWPFCWEL